MCEWLCICVCVLILIYLSLPIPTVEIYNPTRGMQLYVYWSITNPFCCNVLKKLQEYIKRFVLFSSIIVLYTTPNLFLRIVAADPVEGLFICAGLSQSISITHAATLQWLWQWKVFIFHWSLTIPHNVSFCRYNNIDIRFELLFLLISNYPCQSFSPIWPILQHSSQ